MAGGLPALTGSAGQAARWTARALAVFGGLFSVFVILDIVGKMRRLDLPFVLSEAPLGTFEQSTQLGYLTAVAGNALFLLGALMAFRWEVWTTRILQVTATIQLLWLAAHLPTFPREHLAWMLVLTVLLPLSIAGLLVMCREKPRPGSQARATIGRGG